MVRVARFVRPEPKSRRKVSSIVVFHYVLWSVFVLHRAIEFLKRHLVMAGAGVGLTVGLVVEFLGDLPVFPTSELAISLLPNFVMIVACSGLAAHIGVATLRRYNAEVGDPTVVGGLFLALGVFWAACFAGASFIVIMNGWTRVFFWLSIFWVFSALFLTLVTVLSCLPSLKWPDEFLQAMKNSAAWRYECLAGKLKTGLLGIDRLSRRDSVRE